jgi:penicillin-binding protein-related factor A (putative recombinase)
MKIQIIENKKLTKKQKEMINNARDKEWGEPERKDFSKDYEKDAKWFFVKKDEKILALGNLRPIQINYLNKRYSILGICSILSIEKGKGYGTMLINEMLKYLRKKNKTGLGFTTQTEFFKKAGLETKKDFIKRFVYVKPNGEKVYDDEGDGIYYEGKDKFISKVLKTKSPVYIDILHW